MTPLEGISPFEKEIFEGGDTEERTRADGLDDETLTSHALVDLGTKPISDLAVRTEYQTIFKLPSSGCLVFGIHTYIDPLDSLTVTPKAATMIGRTTEKMDKKTLNYRGINQACQENIVKYCNQLAKNI